MKDIPGFEGRYAVTEDGRVWSYPRKNAYKKGLWLKLNRSKLGYLSVYLYAGKSLKGFLVHRLVAQVFLSNLENKPQINHKDGNKENNKMQNLEWVSSSENVKHAYKSGLRSRWRRSGAKINQAIADRIRTEYASGWVTQCELARFHGLNQGTISDIVNFKCWNGELYLPINKDIKS